MVLPLLLRGLIEEKKGILKRVIDHSMTIVRNSGILVTVAGRFMTSHQTGRRNMVGRVVPMK